MIHLHPSILHQTDLLTCTLLCLRNYDSEELGLNPLVHICLCTPRLQSLLCAGLGPARPYAAHDSPATGTDLISRANCWHQSWHRGASASTCGWQQLTTGDAAAGTATAAAAAAVGRRVCAHGMRHGAELQPRGPAGVPGCCGRWAGPQARLACRIMAVMSRDMLDMCCPPRRCCDGQPDHAKHGAKPDQDLGSAPCKKACALVTAPIGLACACRCSIAYGEQYLATYRGHTGPCYQVQWSPMLPDIFLTASADWTVKVWHQHEASSCPDLHRGACLAICMWALCCPVPV